MSHYRSGKPTETVRYFFVGVGKCGTSWQYEFLSRNGAIATPSLKEPYLIDMTPDERRATIAALYPDRGNRQMADFSTLYYWDPENPRKIHDYASNAKIVFTVRRPSDRILSHFGFLRRNGMTTAETVAEYLAGGDPDAIVDRSDYETFVNRYLKIFGRDAVLVLPLEVLRSDPQAYANRMLDFLEIPRVTLDGKDHQIVLKAAEPRSRMVARLAKVVARGLRRMGLLGLLGRLKRTEAIHRLLYRPAVAREPVTDFGPASARVAALDAGYSDFLARHRA